MSWGYFTDGLPKGFYGSENRLYLLSGALPQPRDGGMLNDDSPTEDGCILAHGSFGFSERRNPMMLRLLGLVALASFGILPSSAADAPMPTGAYVCRSPLLAFGFWNSVLHVSQELKIKLTHEIVAQLAVDQGYTDRNGSGPKEPVCIRITSGDLRPIKSGWGGALALADGDKSPVYFHHPDTLGWVHPDYYVQYANDPRVKRAHQVGQDRGQLAPDTLKVAPTGTTADSSGPDANGVGDIVPPQLYYKIEPTYTQEALNSRVQGTVVLYAEVKPNGAADNIRVVKSLDTGLDQRAIEAVRQWRFNPGAKSGRAVTVAATVEVNFGLSDYAGQTFTPPKANVAPRVAGQLSRQDLPHILKWGDPIAGDNVYYDTVVEFEEVSAPGVIVRTALWHEGSRLRVVVFVMNTGNAVLYIDPANCWAYSSTQVDESWAKLVDQPGGGVLPKAAPAPDPLVERSRKDQLGLSSGMYVGSLNPQTLGAGQAIAGDVYFTLNTAVPVLVAVDIAGHSFRFPFSAR